MEVYSWVTERLQRSNDTSGAKTGSELAPGRAEKRSNEVQRINTGTDRDFGRVSGGGNGGRQGDLTPQDTADGSNTYFRHNQNITVLWNCGSKMVITRWLAFLPEKFNMKKPKEK